ncbi:multidrug ABC transporter permease [Candidatus Parcubacteria bacterium]|nr:MAG: multidrug ABC transporter permease [Candidatus Parcubacteria bacterium]
MFNTIYILWLRQVKRYMRSKARLIGSLGQPVLFLVALGYGFGPMYARAGEGDYLQFLAPGIILMSILFTGMFNGIEIIWDKQFGFLKETLAAPVSRFSIVLGRTLGGASVALMQGLIVMGIAMIVGFRPDSFILIIPAILIMFLVALIFTALGTAIASTLEDMHGFQLIMNFLIMPTFFLSGAIFPLEGLPGAISVITKINPLSYGVDGLRQTLTGLGIHSYDLNLLILLFTLIIFLSIGSYLFSRIEV